MQRKAIRMLKFKRSKAAHPIGRWLNARIGSGGIALAAGYLNPWIHQEIDLGVSIPPQQRQWPVRQDGNTASVPLEKFNALPEVKTLVGDLDVSGPRFRNAKKSRFEHGWGERFQASSTAAPVAI